MHSIKYLTRAQQ